MEKKFALDALTSSRQKTILGNSKKKGAGVAKSPLMKIDRSIAPKSAPSSGMKKTKKMRGI